MDAPRRILLVRPSALGDVCRTAPVLATLKRTFPGASIDWLVQDDFGPAVEHHPDLSRVVRFPRRALAEWWRPAVGLRAVRWLGTLREASYDLVLDCQGLFRSGLFTFATGAERRVGYANAKELGWLGLTERADVPRSMHAVDRMLALTRVVGAAPVADMRLYTSEQERAALDSRLRACGTYGVIAPTSRWPGKRWPAERFAQLVTQMLDERLLPAVALVGARSEREQCGPLLELASRDGRVIDLIGRTSVGELMAVVEASALVVANDSAALHMAVGFDRPIVALFGPTRIDRVGPYRRERDVLQRLEPGERVDHKNEALGRAMMARISVSETLEAVRARTGEHRWRDSGAVAQGRPNAQT